MRIPNAVHTSRPWRIHELVGDFRLEDAWELSLTGAREDFTALVALVARFDPSRGSSRAASALWALRWKIGELLGWDGPDAGLDARVATLRERLPPDLRDAPPAPDFEALPFRWLYAIEGECAAEMANKTVHGVMHIGWLAEEGDRHRAQMAVYVKPNGPLGHAYMAAIRPFRHLVVYPPLTRDIERAWRSRVAREAPARV